MRIINMATTQEEIIFIKDVLLAEDIEFGLGEVNQIRNGLTVTGQRVNATHLLFDDPTNLQWHGKSINELLIAILAGTATQA